MEFSTSSKIFATAEFLYSRTTSAVKTPVRFIEPDKISSPAFTSRGRGSPFRLFISSALSPERITQSAGTFSPAFIIMVSPTLSSSGATTRCMPFSKRVAVSLFKSINAEMEFLDEPTAMPCSNSPIWYKSMTATPSMKPSPPKMPSAIAPSEAIAIRKFSSKILPLAMFLAVLKSTV